MNPELTSNGVTIHSASSSSTETKTDLDFDDISFYEEQEALYYDENSVEKIDERENFVNLQNDTTTDGTPAWKGVLCSPFDSHNSTILMKSHVWPGAYAVAHQSYVALKTYLYD